MCHLSLQVWLPLNGNLENQGIYDTVVSNKGATVDNSGKIGKCYSFDGSSNYLYMTSPLSKATTNLSLCCWVNFKALGRIETIFSQRTTVGGGISLFKMSANEIRFDSGTSSSYQWTTKYKVTEANKWMHICVTQDSKYKTLYIDGEMVDQTTAVGDLGQLSSNIVVGQSNHDTGTGIGNVFAGTMNDIRVYDHCLSAREVKEISKALILHYPMNQPEKARNLLRYNGLVNGSATSFSYDVNSDTYTIVSPVGTSTWGYGVTVSDTNRIIVPYGASAVLSFDVLVPTAMSISIDVNNYAVSGTSWSGNDNDNVAKRSHSSYNIPANTWTRVWSYYENTNSLNTSKIDIYEKSSIGLVTSSSSSSTTWYIKNPKFELTNETDHPWSSCWENNDSWCDGVEYDVSGYLNNGTVNTATIPTWSSNSPKYGGCYSFDGTKSFIACGLGAKVTDEITISCWAYMDDWSTYSGRIASCTEGGGWNFEPISGKINFALYVGTSGYSANVTTKETPSKGWHHFVGTWDGMTKSLYMDGILQGSATAATTKTKIGYHSTNSIFIGAEAGGSATTPAANAYFNGKISDVRIYATALKQDDVTSLYKTRFEIDDAGNIYCAELEQAQQNVSFNDNGLLMLSGLSNLSSTQDMDIEVLSDGSAWAKIFWHNNSGGTQLFASYDECVNTSSEYKYSKLYMLDNFRALDGKFEFILRYPNDNTKYNRWKQTNNPLKEYLGITDGTLFATGYEAIHIDSTSNYWGGLTRQNSTETGFSPCLLSGSVGHSNWFYTIGAASMNNGGIPSASGFVSSGATLSLVELLVRVDTLPEETTTKIFDQYISCRCLYES